MDEAIRVSLCYQIKHFKDKNIKSLYCEIKHFRLKRKSWNLTFSFFFVSPLKGILLRRRTWEFFLEDLETKSFTFSEKGV